MKRKLAAALCAAMVVGSAASAAAAPSVQSGSVDGGQITVTTPAAGEGEGTPENGESGRVYLVELNLEEYPEETQQLIQAVKDVQPGDTVADVFGSVLDLEDLKGLKVFDEKDSRLTEEDGLALLEKLHFLSDIQKVVFENVEPTREKPVGLEFPVNNVTDNMEVYILTHCEEDSWELLETEEVSDNQVKAMYHAKADLAAVVYMEKEELDEEEEGVGTSPATVAADTEENAEEDTEE